LAPDAIGQRAEETKSINKSLSSLTDVFTAIGQNDSHVPFRNSKLTYLLQPALSGDGMACMSEYIVNTWTDCFSICSEYLFAYFHSRQHLAYWGKYAGIVVQSEVRWQCEPVQAW
jgi:hypothetical protein